MALFSHVKFTFEPQNPNVGSFVLISYKLSDSCPLVFLWLLYTIRAIKTLLTQFDSLLKQGAFHWFFQFNGILKSPIHPEIGSEIVKSKEILPKTSIVNLPRNLKGTGKQKNTCIWYT